MRCSAESFFASPGKAITLLGMSGVGKTRLAKILRKDGWFHYSVDYRIGTRYLDEAILDNIKLQAMQVPFLHDLLMSDSIFISNNISYDNLAPLSTWLGMLGNPELGGLSLKEFKRRQALHKEAEIKALKDVDPFIDRARDIYKYNSFLNDVSGSLCELDDEAMLQKLADRTLMIYLKADKEDEQFLIERAESHPKPLYYRESFLDEHLAIYMREKALDYVALIDPKDFARWVFPHLFYTRVPRYEEIAQKYGYTIRARDAFEVATAEDFYELVAQALTEQN